MMVNYRVADNRRCKHTGGVRKGETEMKIRWSIRNKLLVGFAGVVAMLVILVVANWIMMIPNTAVQRGIIIGAALGAAATALRIILGLERTYMGRG